MANSINDYIARYKAINNGKHPPKEVIDQLKLTPTPRKKLEQLVKPSPVEQEKPKLKTKLPENFIIRSVLFIIAIGCIIISIHYSRLWLLDFLEPIKATLLATIIVLYLVFSLEAGIILHRRKYNFMAVCIFITGFIVFLFSLTSTIAGQFNINSEKLFTSTDQKNVMELEVLQEQKETIKNNLDILKKDFESSQKGLEEKEGKEYDREFWKNYRIKKDIDKYTEELKIIDEKILTFLSSDEKVVEEKRDFYSWIGAFIKADKNFIEFFLSIFPAIFIDIISPLGMFVAMGLYKKKEENY